MSDWVLLKGAGHIPPQECQGFENIGIDVAEAWATPATTWQAFTYAEESTVVQDTYQLDLYERNIQIGIIYLNVQLHLVKI